jgi:hypothetical protein
MTAPTSRAIGAVGSSRLRRFLDRFPVLSFVAFAVVAFVAFRLVAMSGAVTPRVRLAVDPAHRLVLVENHGPEAITVTGVRAGEAAGSSPIVVVEDPCRMTGPTVERAEVAPGTAVWLRWTAGSGDLPSSVVSVRVDTGWVTRTMAVSARSAGLGC